MVAAACGSEPIFGRELKLFCRHVTLTDTRYDIAQRSTAEEEFKKIGAQVLKLLPNLTP